MVNCNKVRNSRGRIVGSGQYYVENERRRNSEKSIRSFGLAFLTVTICVGSTLAAEQVYIYHTDPAGTLQAMTDSTGKVVWKADYKPFGEEQSVTATTSNDKRFVGKEKDEETGLSYFGARYQDAKTSRFISPDPVRAVDPHASTTNEQLLLNPQRLNTCAYALNNPYRYVDPDGRDVWDIGFFAYSAYNFVREPSRENAAYLVFIRKLHPNTMQFPDRKRGFFRSGKETKRLRGGILQYVAQATLQVDTARAEKDRFRMETI